MWKRYSASAALLPFALAAWSCAVQQKQSKPELLAVLIDMASKKPVPSARVILAPKTEGKLECTIDTSLTGVSNARGEVRIPNVGPGEYVVFYSLSGSLKPGLQGKVLNYDPGDHGDPGQGRGIAQVEAIQDSLVNHGLLVFKGYLPSEASKPEAQEGKPVINGYACVLGWDLAIISFKGELLKIHLPSAESAPVKIEVSTELSPMCAR